MLDVPGDEPRHRCARRTDRVDLQPQLRRPSGTWIAHAPGLAADGRRGSNRRPFHRHQKLGEVTMKAIETITGQVSVLNRDDVDTDQIIPKQFLKRIARSGFGEFLFFDWVREPGWHLPPNLILVAGQNFGCGSSREHAAWALEDYGFQAIIAPSFGDIFHSNCTKIGLLPVRLSPDQCASIAQAGEAQIDLAAQEVRWPGGTAQFEIDWEIKHRLLSGLDDIAVTLAEDTEGIDAYERDRERSGPVTTAL